MKYFTKDMISLCGGLPSSEYFPFESIGAKIPVPTGFSEKSTRESGVEVSMGKHDVKRGDRMYDLSIALNYGQSMGPPQMIRFLTEHTEIVHSPKYSDWDIVMTAGSTSALDIALRMFCQRGDCVLTEEYSFSSAIETMLPMGITPVGVAIDDLGMKADSLDQILTGWNESEKGAPKPFVVYFVPTGQNPSGATQTAERRRAIYAVAEKHDLILLEDEPYYFLQMDEYKSGTIREVAEPFVAGDPADFLKALIPSYLSLDVSGRVIRMDSFSKVIAPGSRMGWITAPLQICERFIRHQEVSSQTPSGFTSTIMYQLLEEQWGHKGFLQWLMFIRAEYTRRRDIMVNACEKYLPAGVSRWKAPAAGMFHWIEVDALKHPGVEKGEVAIAEVEEKVFLAAVASNVLVAKGSWFRAEKDNKYTFGSANGVMGKDQTTKSTDLFFRMTFAAASEEQIVEAVKRFGDALKAEFGV